MSVSQLSPPVPKPGPSARDGRVVLYDMDWPDYEKMLDAIGNRRVRLTYDRGILEIMTLSGVHEWWKRRFGLVLPLLGAELKIRVQGYASTSVRRRDLKRGLDPDEFFYIAHAGQIAGPREFDFTRDPAPDLAIEIELSASSLDRLAIYAALQVPEVWRFDGDALRVYHLQTNGEYAVAERSLGFPTLPLGPFVEYLKATQHLDDAQLIDPFREWARSQAMPAAGDASGLNPSGS
jgi:Uma2 family endonuclease